MTPFEKDVLKAHYQDTMAFIQRLASVYEQEEQEMFLTLENDFCKNQNKLQAIKDILAQFESAEIVG